ncbi:GNAT family protein [Algihabitans albus]|uniref:GNAT family N-acetyltransferase n=1 Tax=Algihabitans albus TaxID=2164067 RepID=UPI0035D01C44
MLFPALIGETSSRGPKLTGERVTLRQPTSRDWRAWAELRHASRQFLMPWEPAWPHDALTRAAYRRRLRQQAAEWRQGLGVTFFIFDRRSEHLLGGISVTNLRRGVAQTASLGYWLGERHVGQRVMTEALLLLLDYLFGSLGLHRVEAACLPHNAASRRLLEKIGFREEGCGRGYLRIAGQWQDHMLYGLLADDPRGAASPAWTPTVADRSLAEPSRIMTATAAAK